MKKDWNRNALIELFFGHADKGQAEPMSAYMRNKFPFLGIRSPLRQQLLRQVFAHYEMPKGEQLLHETAAIFELPEREFQYAAIAILDRRKKQLGTSRFNFPGDVNY